MFNDFQYVVKFPNGKYYSGYITSLHKTEELSWANKYGFEWQPLKDLYLQRYCNEKNYTYELIKVKTVYEIVE